MRHLSTSWDSGGENVLHSQHHFHSYIADLSHPSNYVWICALLSDFSQVWQIWTEFEDGGINLRIGFKNQNALRFFITSIKVVLFNYSRWKSCSLCLKEGCYAYFDCLKSVPKNSVFGHFSRIFRGKCNKWMTGIKLKKYSGCSFSKTSYKGKVFYTNVDLKATQIPILDRFLLLTNTLLLLLVKASHGLYRIDSIFSWNELLKAWFYKVSL